MFFQSTPLLPHGSDADAVLGRPELLERVLRNLTRFEATQVRVLPEEWAEARLTLGDECLKVCRSRLVLTSSGNSKLVEVDPVTGEVIRCVKARPPRKTKSSNWSSVPRRRWNRVSWITSLAFSPYDNDLYVSQYKVSGVERYHGQTLEYKKQFCSHPELGSPEGIAFTNGAMFVASCDNGTIVKVSLKGQVLEVIKLAISEREVGTSHLVPWGLAASPMTGRDHLFVAVDEGFEGATYADAPQTGKGAVLELLRDHKGSGYTCQPVRGSKMSRPSGVHCSVQLQAFDPQGNLQSFDLYVTSMDRPVLKATAAAHSPLNEPGDQAASLVPLSGDISSASCLSTSERQWDVCVVKDSLFVTVHACKKDHGRLLQYSRADGRLLRIITSPQLQEPNMMAVQT